MEKYRQKIGYIKAAKRGERLARLENSNGFVANTKICKSKKIYSRRKYRLDDEI